LRSRTGALADCLDLRCAGAGIDNQLPAAMQRLAADREQVAGEFLPFQRQSPHRFPVVAGDRTLVEKGGGKPMRRQTGQLAAAEAVGEPIELQPPVGLPRALADQRNRVLDKIGLFVGEQLGAIADRRDGPNQIMAETRGQHLEHAQIDGLVHRGMLAC
jgi:hypothetical protein